MLNLQTIKNVVNVVNQKKKTTKKSRQLKVDGTFSVHREISSSDFFKSAVYFPSVVKGAGIINSPLITSVTHSIRDVKRREHLSPFGMSVFRRDRTYYFHSRFVAIPDPPVEWRKIYVYVICLEKYPDRFVKRNLSGLFPAGVLPTLLLENKINRPDQTQKAHQVVEPQVLVLEKQEHKDGEDRQGDHLLDDLEFHQRKRPSGLLVPQTIGRYHKAVLQQGDAPTDQHHRPQAEF